MSKGYLALGLSYSESGQEKKQQQVHSAVDIE
jgi:hypothetical protein